MSKQNYKKYKLVKYSKIVYDKQEYSQAIDDLIDIFDMYKDINTLELSFKLMQSFIKKYRVKTSYGSYIGNYYKIFNINNSGYSIDFQPHSSLGEILSFQITSLDSYYVYIYYANIGDHYIKSHRLDHLNELIEYLKHLKEKIKLDDKK